VRVLNWNGTDGVVTASRTRPFELVPTSKVVSVTQRYRIVISLVMTPSWTVQDPTRPNTLLVDTAWAMYGHGVTRQKPVFTRC